MLKKRFSIDFDGYIIYKIMLTIATIMNTSNIACVLPLRSLSKVIQYENDSHLLLSHL
jgi:hypothetical protein